MKYFQNFPSVNYQMSEFVESKLQQITRTVPNMTIGFTINYKVGDYEWYRIGERDRPDTLAAQWYDSTQYTWVVLLSNNMRDLYDWPMSELEFYDYINRKYESSVGVRDGVVRSHQLIYEYRCTDDITGVEFVVDEPYYTASTLTKREITVYDYEHTVNDKKHDIRRLTVPTFTLFIKQFDTLVK